MDIKMNFNKILIQDVVNKRDYSQDPYRTTTEVSEDDESYLTDEFNENDTGSNLRTSPIDVSIERKASANLMNNAQPFGEENHFIYADSQIFDHIDTNYGSEIGRDSLDKLISAIDLLKVSISNNTYVQDQKHNLGRSTRTPGHRHRRNTGGYLDDAQNRKSFDHYTHDERMMKRKDKVMVEIRVVFLKIGEIDTLKEIYHADAFMQAKWREPKLDDKDIEEIKPSELERMWNPLLFIDNILNETKDQYWLSAAQNDRKEAFIIERRKLKGVFLETLELNDFPLDVQDLTITISSERPDSEIDLVPDNVELSGINLQTFVDQQEWKLHEHVEVTKRVVTQEYTSSSRRRPCLSVTCRASRRPGYFYWNVFLIMFFITGLSFATFAVPADQTENRLQLSFTLFLTSVAFKFVINQSLPRISYLTYMDKYVLMSLGILCIVSIWHSVVTLINPSTFEGRIPPMSQQLVLQSLFSHLDNNSSTDLMDANTLLKIIILKTKSNLSLRPVIQKILKGKLNPVNQRPNDTDKLSTLPLHIPSSKETKRKNKQLSSKMLNLQAKVERDVLISFGLLYFIAHLLFIFWLYFDASKRRREMKEKDRQYKDWVKRNNEWSNYYTQQHSYGQRSSSFMINSV